MLQIVLKPLNSLVETIDTKPFVNGRIGKSNNIQSRYQIFTHVPCQVKKTFSSNNDIFFLKRKDKSDNLSKQHERYLDLLR